MNRHTKGNMITSEVGRINKHHRRNCSRCRSGCALLFFLAWLSRCLNKMFPMIGALCLVRPRCFFGIVFRLTSSVCSSPPEVPGPLNTVFPMIVAMSFDIPSVFLSCVEYDSSCIFVVSSLDCWMKCFRWLYRYSLSLFVACGLVLNIACLVYFLIENLGRWIKCFRCLSGCALSFLVSRLCVLSSRRTCCLLFSLHS